MEGRKKTYLEDQYQFLGTVKFLLSHQMEAMMGEVKLLFINTMTCLIHGHKLEIH